jgi:archaellum component FlaC
MIPGDVTLGGINRGDLGAFGLFVKAVQDVRDAFDDSSESGGLFRGVIAGMIPEINEAGNVVRELDDEVAELGPRSSAAQIPLEAASGAFAEMGVEARDLSDDLDDTTDSVNKFEDGLNKAADSVDFLTSELNKLDDDLGELDALAAIEQQFKRIADTEDLEEQQTEIRRLIRLVGDYVGELENIPADKVTEIISVLRSGDVDRIRTLLDELTQDRFINVSIVPKQSAFESLNAVFQAGAAPTAPTFTNPNPSPVPVDMSTKIYNYPIGTTTTSVYVDQQTDFRRNGAR